MTNAAFLKTFRDLRKELLVMEQQLERCGVTGRPSGLRTHGYDNMPRGTNDATAAAIQLQEGLEQMVNQQREQISSMEPHFLQLVKRARNFRDRCILNQYYYLGVSDTDLAEPLCLSVRHVNRLRNDLLTYLDNTPEMS